jgi:glycine C-acetyltransferase
MSTAVNERIDAELEQLKETGQYKYLRHLSSPMGPQVDIEDHGNVVMLCSNDYLGLANHPAVVAAGIEGLKKYGAGTASVRFITGTFDVHREIESKIAALMGTEAALTYVSAWTANEALFPTLVGSNDVIVSDSLNHASLIDSIRQVRGAERAIYQHGDLDEVERKLQGTKDKDARWIITDGVFSMEGDIVDLPRLRKLADEYDAILVVDDSHGTGVMGSTGRGTHEHFDLLGKVDVITGTLGKALGGAAGGYVAASQRFIDLLVQRSRTSLFSNALPATVACSAAAAIDVLQSEPQRVDKLRANVAALKNGLEKLGYEVHGGPPSAILPIIVGETADAIAKSKRLLELGVMVIGFGYPVVPKGQARLRIQASAALEAEHIERALGAFAQL